MKMTLLFLLCFFAGVVAADFLIDPPLQPKLVVVPVEQLSRLTVHCSLYGGRGVITVAAPTPKPTVTPTKESK